MNKKILLTGILCLFLTTFSFASDPPPIDPLVCEDGNPPSGNLTCEDGNPPSGNRSGYSSQNSTDKSYLDEAWVYILSLIKK